MQPWGDGLAVHDRIRSMGAESEHYFAELDAVTVDECPLTLRLAQVLVIDDHRIGVRKVGHRPLAVGEVEAGVLPAHGARLQGNVSWRRDAGVTTHHELQRLARYAHEPDLAMFRLSAHHLEPAREQLDRFLHRTTEAYGFGLLGASGGRLDVRGVEHDGLDGRTGHRMLLRLSDLRAIAIA